LDLSTKNIHRIFSGFSVKRIVTGSWRENCYLLTDTATGRVLVIDPGDELERIISGLSGSVELIDDIVITHGHHDHMGAADELSKASEVLCKVHNDDVPLFRRAPLYALALENKRVLTPEKFETFYDRQVFRFGESQVQVWWTPGHTPGSSCLYIEGCLFTGDTLFKEAVGRSDLPGGSQDMLRKSVERILADLPGDEVIFPGHGSEWTIGEAREWWASASEFTLSETDHKW